MQNDESLILRMQNRETEAMGIMYSRYHMFIINFLKKRVPNLSYDDIHDISQDTWIKAWASCHTFKGGTVKGWLATIAIHLFIDKIGRRKKLMINVPDHNYFANEGEYPYSENDLHSEIDLRSMVNQLEARQRDVVVLKVYGNLRHKEIIKVLKLKSTNTSITRYRTATIELRKKCTQAEFLNAK